MDDDIVLLKNIIFYLFFWEKQFKIFEDFFESKSSFFYFPDTFLISYQNLFMLFVPFIICSFEVP